MGYFAVMVCLSVAGVLLDIQEYFELSDREAGLLQTGNEISKVQTVHFVLRLCALFLKHKLVTLFFFLLLLMCGIARFHLWAG